MPPTLRRARRALALCDSMSLLAGGLLAGGLIAGCQRPLAAKSPATPIPMGPAATTPLAGALAARPGGGAQALHGGPPPASGSLGAVPGAQAAPPPARPADLQPNPIPSNAGIPLTAGASPDPGTPTLLGGGGGGISGSGTSLIAELVPGLTPTADQGLLITTAILAKGGGSILAKGGGSILAKGGGSILAKGGGSILAKGGGSILAKGGGSLVGPNAYRTASLRSVQYDLGSEFRLPNAFVYLTDPGEALLPDASPSAPPHANLVSLTNANGDAFFRKDQLPAAPGPVILNAIADGDVRVTGFLDRSAVGVHYVLSLATTLAFEFLRGVAAADHKRLDAYPFEKLQPIIDATHAALDASDAQGLFDTTHHPADLFIPHLSFLRRDYLISFGVADFGNARLRAISDAWRDLLGFRPVPVDTVAGTDVQSAGVPAVGTHGDAASFPLDEVESVAVDSRGITYLSTFNGNAPDHNGAIHRILPTGELQTLKVQFDDPSYPDPGLFYPRSITVDETTTPKSLIVCDLANYYVGRLSIMDDANPSNTSFRLIAGVHPKVDPALVPPADNTVAGGAQSRYRVTDEGQAGTTVLGADGSVDPAHPGASIGSPFGTAVDPDGNVYVADTFNHRVRMLCNRAGTYFGVAMQGPVLGGDGKPYPRLYTIAGNPTWGTDAEATAAGEVDGQWLGDFSGEGVPGVQARLDQPISLAFAPADAAHPRGSLLIAEQENQVIRRLDVATGAIAYFAGNPAVLAANGSSSVRAGHPDKLPGGFDGDEGTRLGMTLSNPVSVRVDPLGIVYVADDGNNRVRAIDPAGRATTIAGSGSQANVDGEARQVVQLSSLGEIAFDATGNVLIPERSFRKVRRAWWQWERDARSKGGSTP